MFDSAPASSDILNAMYDARRRMNAETLESLESKKDWSWLTFSQILILCAYTKQYPSALRMPETIMADGLYRQAEQLRASSATNGDVETTRAFIADHSQVKLLLGHHTIGTAQSARIDRSVQVGQELSQTCVGAIHLHPDAMLNQKGINPFSPTDFLTFARTPDDIFESISMGDHIVLMLKSSITNTSLTESQISSLIQEISREHMTSRGNWEDMIRAIRANKELCTVLGLFLYVGKRGEPLKRIRVTQSSENRK